MTELGIFCAFLIILNSISALYFAFGEQLLAGYLLCLNSLLLSVICFIEASK